VSFQLKNMLREWPWRQKRKNKKKGHRK